MTHYRNLDKPNKAAHNMTFSYSILLAGSFCTIPAGLDWTGVRSHSLLHPCCCYLYLSPPTAERSRVAYGTDITEKAPCSQAREAVGTSQEQLSQATTLKSTAHNPSRWIQWRLSNLSSFMYELPGRPTAGGGETLVPPQRNLGGIILSELFIVHEGDIF